MDNYRAKASKRNYEQQNPKQREKRKSTFNQYNNLYLNSPVNFISSGNNEHSKNDNEDDENNINGRCEQYPSPPSPPNMRNHDYEVHQTPQLKGIGGKLLLQMGYEPGKGLGKNLQGIQVPIKAKPRYGRGAIGAYGPENINALPIETINRNSRGYDNKNKQQCFPDTIGVLPDNLLSLMSQISSKQTLNENLYSIDMENKLLSDIKDASWTKFMNKMRSSLFENFGYDPKNDSKLFVQQNLNNTNQNSTRLLKKEKQAKIKIVKVPDSLKVAVIDTSDAEGKIRNINHQEILREALDNALFQRLDNSTPNLIPSCYWSGFKDDIFKIICEDEQSKICIHELVKSIGNLWYDANLCVVGLEELLNIRTSLNRGNTFNPIVWKKMFKKLSREFDQNWRENERNTRRIVENSNLKPSSRNNQIIKNLKRTKAEQDFLVNIQSVPDSLKIAIIDKNDVEGKIRIPDHQNLLHETLYSAIAKICKDPNIMPRFYLSGFKDNIFQIICYDEQSKICMEEIVKNIGNLWNNADLVVVDLEEILHIQQTSTNQYNPIESEFNQLTKQYDDIWNIDEEFQSDELNKIRNKPDANLKEQRKFKPSKTEDTPARFIINIRKISHEKFKQYEFKGIKESIELFIHETIKSQEFFPQFEDITNNGENVYINCANLPTQEWFSKTIIPKFSLYPPWENAEFMFEIINNYEDNKMEKRIQAKIWFPGLKFKTDDYLKMLQAQNNSLDTKLWSIGNRKDATDGVHLYVVMDKISALILTSLNKRPYFGSGRAEVKF